MSDEIVVITRPKNRSQAAVDIVTNLGGIAKVVPTLELKIVCSEKLLLLFEKLNELDWLIFTSPTAVKSVFQFYPKIREKLNSKCKIGVIGPKTAKCVESYGLKCDLIPENYTAEGLLEEFEARNLKGKLIGIPRTMSAREVLPKELIKRGANVIVAKAYESDIPANKTKINELINCIKKYEIDAITFTSPLTVHNLFNDLNDFDKKEVIEKLKSDKIYVSAIGPITGNVLKEYGIDPIIPEKYTVEDMLYELFKEMNKN